MALMATRPTRAMSAMCAMPCTTVQKMIGAISILIALMKASPSGCILAASSGCTIPSTMPATIAIKTWIQSSFHQARVRGLSIESVVIPIPETAVPHPVEYPACERKRGPRVPRRPCSGLDACHRTPLRRLVLLERRRLERGYRCPHQLLDRAGRIAPVGLATRQARDALGRHQRVVECAEQEMAAPDDVG